MFHLGLSSPPNWISYNGRVTCPVPGGLGTIQIAECANDEIASLIVKAVRRAPVDLRDAVFKHPESAAVALLQVVECWDPDSDSWTFGPTNQILTPHGRIRAHLREWIATTGEGTFAPRTSAAVRAFVQSALDAADALDAARSK